MSALVDYPVINWHWDFHVFPRKLLKIILFSNSVTRAPLTEASKFSIPMLFVEIPYSFYAFLLIETFKYRYYFWGVPIKMRIIRNYVFSQTATVFLFKWLLECILVINVMEEVNQISESRWTWLRQKWLVLNKYHKSELIRKLFLFE